MSYGGSARSLPQAGRGFDCHGAQVVFIFQKNDDHYVLNCLMHFINTNASQVQWLGGSAVIHDGLCSSLLLGRFFENFSLFFTLEPVAQVRITYLPLIFPSIFALIYNYANY